LPKRQQQQQQQQRRRQQQVLVHVCTLFLFGAQLHVMLQVRIFTSEMVCQKKKELLSGLGA